MSALTINAQVITLPTPDTKGGLPFNQAIAKRRSVREYDSSRPLDLQTISNLLWATCGINRVENAMRTNPTARNFQEVDAYWFDNEGVYLYDYKKNALKKVATGDYRSLIAGGNGFTQDFVMEAPGSVLLVIDFAKIPTGEASEQIGYIDAGIACENINLFCAANGLATVPRMSMDKAEISKLLSLPATSIPAMNNPIGYAR